MITNWLQGFELVVILTYSIAPALAVEFDASGGPLSYDGRVIENATRTPVRDAKVTVTRFIWPDPQTGGRRVLQQTVHRTDAAGNYHFTTTPAQMAETRLAVHVSVAHPDHPAGGEYYHRFGNLRRNETEGERTCFEIKIPQGKPITGVVETPDGRPAVDVPVRAFSYVDPGAYPGALVMGSLGETQTDHHGRFRLVVATPGKVDLRAIPTEFAVAVRELKEDERGDIGRLILREGARLTGRVLDADGTPLAGVAVSAAGFPKEPKIDYLNDESRWDSIGSFSRASVTGPQGEFALEPLPPGFYSVVPVDRYHGDPEFCGFHQLPAPFVATRVRLKDGDAPGPLEIRALEHVVIKAKLHDSHGKPSQGPHPMIYIHGTLNVHKPGDAKPQAGRFDALVGNFEGPSWRGPGWPDAQGNIVIRVPRGLLNATLYLGGLTDDRHVVRHRLGNEPVRNGEFWSMGAITRDIKDIELICYESSTLTVRALARDGSKTEQVRVAGWYRDSVNGGLSLGIIPDVDFMKHPDGRFWSRRLLPDEPVTVSVDADGYEPRFETLTLSPGATKELNVVLERK